MMPQKSDQDYMRIALSLARRSLGQTWPNPAVGCVLVKDGRIVGQGFTQPTGRPHAEVMALAMAGEAARGAIAYVTLEPCSHHGKTPPCADALIQAGVARVVASLTDPDPRVNGQGLKRLQQAGIPVECGLLAEEAAALNAGFIKRVLHNRPLLTMKIASSLDGRIATAKGESQWISNALSRARTHLMRAETDAVMVGSGAALVDNPELTCRLPGLENRSPLRLLVDSRLRLPLTSKLAITAKDIPTWIFTRPDADRERQEAFRDFGVEIIPIEIGSDQRLDMVHLFHVLGARGLTSVLVEPGAHLAASLLRSDLVDRLVWVHAPLAIGGDGLPAASPLGIAELAKAERYKLEHVERLDDDVIEFLSRKEE